MSDQPRALQSELDALSSVELLTMVREGNRDALDVLFSRYLRPLSRWTHSRLPGGIRDISDTDDVVQDALLRTFKRIELFEPERAGSLNAYLKQAVMNQIRDEFRRARRREPNELLESDVPADGPSPFEQAIASELLDDYDSALMRLRAEEREAIVARLEIGLTYEELADTFGRPNANAARSFVVRALQNLAEEMGRA